MTPRRSATTSTDRDPLVREFSAGGVVVRRFRGRPFLAAVRVKRGAALALPKGNIERGESGVETAVREVREETGLRTEALEKLGDVRYWYVRRDGRRVFKVVSFFLCRYLGGSLRDFDPEEVDGAEWLPLAEAPRLLAYQGEREMAEAALARATAAR